MTGQLLGYLEDTVFFTPGCTHMHALSQDLHWATIQPLKHNTRKLEMNTLYRTYD